MIRWIVRSTFAVLALIAIVAIFNWQRIYQLYHATTLFEESRIVHNFSHMGDIFHSKSVPAATSSSQAHRWTVENASLPATYKIDGVSKNLQKTLKEFQTTSLLVLKNGKLVHESYHLGTGKDDQRISWSMAKSVLSAMVGIAIREGKIGSLDALASSYVPELANSAYENVSLRNLLTMSSGIKFDEDYLSFNSDINRMGRVLGFGGSMDEFALSLKNREREPGVARHYISIDTHVLAMVLRAATKQSVPEYFAQKLWNPLRSPNECYYLTDGYGVAFALGGLNMTTHDYARFGQLYLDNGQWMGKQIVPSEWIDMSTRPNGLPSAENHDDMRYGYQWWIPPYGEGEFFVSGVYGQYIYINRPASVVIVKTGAHRGFRNDTKNGFKIKSETIAMFRAIASHLSDWENNQR